jgi:hypothetical protein
VLAACVRARARDEREHTRELELLKGEKPHIFRCRPSGWHDDEGKIEMSTESRR